MMVSLNNKHLFLSSSLSLFVKIFPYFSPLPPPSISSSTLRLFSLSFIFVLLFSFPNPFSYFFLRGLVPHYSALRVYNLLKSKFFSIIF
jgi:hypothetical protein